MVEEIAARRKADLEAAFVSEPSGARDALADAPAPRGFVERFVAPGLHLIAEIKRSSPSAGRIAGAGEDIVERARAYQAGGAAAISVLCEPHWFGGSVEDLRAVRAAVSIPVLAKEFVVDARQLELLRAAGADAVLVLAVLHPTKRRLRTLVDQALALGLEPLVEVHDERELGLALETDARLIGINNRDLRTLAVDPERAGRLRGLVPDDRVVIAESGVRDPETIARWRAQGFDGALVGEALMRSADAAAAARAFVAAGVPPTDPANVARRPFVKICGVGDIGSAIAAASAGADALGLNLVPGTPRALALDEAAGLARAIRDLTSEAARPRIVAITVDATAEDLAAIVAALDPDAIQCNGDEPIEVVAAAGRPVWKVLHLPAEPPADITAAAARVAERGRAFLAAGAERLLLDTAGGPHPGGTGQRASTALAAAVARELPVTLAGGLSAANVAGALRDVPAVGVDVASGVEFPREPGQRPVKDPYLVGLFVKRARAARDDRPNTPFGPTPVPAGLLDADGAGRWGLERDFGGRYVPETLMAALEQLETAYDALRHDPVFWAELRGLLERFAGRPTPIYRADRLAEAVRAEAARLADTGRRGPAPRIPDLRLYLKREDLAHTGAHKINNALGQALLTRRLGKIAGHRRDRRRPARRRDRDRVCAARPAVRRVHGRRGHRAPGSQRPAHARARRRGPLGHVGDGHAQGRGQRGDARLGHERRDDPLRARLGDGPAPLSHDRARPPAAHRRRGRGPAPGRRGTAARRRGGVRRRRLERDRAPGALHRRAVGPSRGRRGGRRRDGDRAPRRGHPRRHARHPARLALADAPGPRRPGRRGAFGVGRAGLPGHRPAAGRPGRGRPDRGRRRDRPRGRRRDEDHDPDRRASCPPSRPRTRSRPCRGCSPGSTASAVAGRTRS